METAPVSRVPGPRRRVDRDRRGARVAGAVLGRAPGGGDRQRGPSAPGPRQLVGQRAGRHAGGDHGHGAGGRGRRRRRDRGARPGPGMPDEEARRAFERFDRVDPARTRSSGGSGSASPSWWPSWRRTGARSPRRPRRAAAWSSPCDSRRPPCTPATNRSWRARPPNQPPMRRSRGGTSWDSHRAHSRPSRSLEAGRTPCVT